jgi:putative Ca2+/H+ antiporter (TMEM165/GDT1 family)
MLPIFFATYAAVFMAEIVGDKLLYTTGLLATRYKTFPILCGMAMAFMLKMAVAVLVGHIFALLPKWLVASVTAINFFAIALVIWRKKDKREVTEKNYKTYQAALVAFSMIFFSEWGDVGQVTAATMAARFNSPLAVWLGAVAAMVTKGTAAASAAGFNRTSSRKRCATRRPCSCWCWACFPCGRFWTPTRPECFCSSFAEW